MNFQAGRFNALFKPLVAGFILILLVISGCGQGTQTSPQPVQQSLPSAQKLPKEAMPADTKPAASMESSFTPQQGANQPANVQPPTHSQSTSMLPPRTQQPQGATLPPLTGQEPPVYTPPPPPAVAPLT
ncbi:MAG: hypothetical protein NUV31_10800, partial [Dehalococcoidales bacterium]|nr:hypothetical protein [Dehalococcoidales bacterium]